LVCELLAQGRGAEPNEKDHVRYRRVARDICRHNFLSVDIAFRNIPKFRGLAKILVEDMCSARRAPWPQVAICSVGDTLLAQKR
jgi:hypothetical protein